jgi:hypothetical protein
MYGGYSKGGTIHHTKATAKEIAEKARSVGMDKLKFDGQTVSEAERLVKTHTRVKEGDWRYKE